MNIIKGLEDSTLLLVLLIIIIVMLLTLGIVVFIAMIIGFSEIILFNLKLKQLEKAGVLIPNHVYLDRDKKSKKFILKKKRRSDIKDYLQIIVNLDESEINENHKIDLGKYDVPKDKKTISKP